MSQFLRSHDPSISVLRPFAKAAGVPLGQLVGEVACPAALARSNGCVPNSEWSKRRITTSAQHILEQIPLRAVDRGLHFFDDSVLPMMALWTIANWERKVGRVALETTSGADRFGIIRDLDDLLNAKFDENPVAYDQQQKAAVYVKTRLPVNPVWDFGAILEPLICQAERESHGMNHDYVGSEHLVLASIALADSSLLSVLQKHRIEYPTTRLAVIEILGA